MKRVHHTLTIFATEVESCDQLTDAYYADLTQEFGEHPGQWEAFKELLEYLEPSDTNLTWHAAMLAFGLGLAEDEAARRFVVETSAMFLRVATPVDESTADA